MLLVYIRKTRLARNVFSSLSAREVFVHDNLEIFISFDYSPDGIISTGLRFWIDINRFAISQVFEQ